MIYSLKISFILFALFSCAVEGRNEVTESANQSIHETDYAAVFVQHFTDYKSQIDAAGLADITAATLSHEGDLTIEYAYTAGNEKRRGVMRLKRSKVNKYKGTWKTTADNGTVYEGEMEYFFKENGTAEGTYFYGGLAYGINLFLD